LLAIVLHSNSATLPLNLAHSIEKSLA